MNNFLFAFIAIILLTNQEAHAYIKPGSGSDFIAMIISAFIFIKKLIADFFSKIKEIFCKKKNNSQK